MGKATAKQMVNPDHSATISFNQPFLDASDLVACVSHAAKIMIQQAIAWAIKKYYVN